MRRAVGCIPARANTGRPAHSGRGGAIQTPGLPGRDRLFFCLNSSLSFPRYAPSSNWNRRQELHPHYWVRSPGSSLLDDSGMVAGDGIEPPLPAYETGLAPLQLSRNKLAATIRLSKITISWHRVKDSNPHRRVWNPQCFRLHQPCTFKLGPEPRPRRGARLRAGSVGLRADVNLTGLGNSQLQPSSFTALTRQCLAANHSAPGRFLPANRRNRPLISTS